MKAITDSIEIRTTPERLFKGVIKVFSSNKEYRAWHPDHVKCQWLEGGAFEIGSILYAEEYLHGELHRMKCVTTKLVRNRTIEYRFLFPVSVICPKGSFGIERKEKGCIFSATLYFRFVTIFSILGKSRIEAVKRHMKEEGTNLRKLLEG